MSDEINGCTREGRTLVVRETSESWTQREFIIDGEIATMTARPSVYRDGGTRVYTTNRGTVTFPRRLGSNDRTPRLDGHRVVAKNTQP